jgi:hypothetical protein
MLLTSTPLAQAIAIILIQSTTWHANWQQGVFPPVRLCMKTAKSKTSFNGMNKYHRDGFFFS